MGLFSVLGLMLTVSGPWARAEVYSGEVKELDASEGTLKIDRLEGETGRGKNREVELKVETNPEYPSSVPLEDLAVGSKVLVEAGRDGEVDSLISGSNNGESLILLRGDDAKGETVKGAKS